MKLLIWLGVVLVAAGMLWFLSGRAGTSTAVTVGLVVAGGVPLAKLVRTLWLQRTGRLHDGEGPEGTA